MAEKPHISRDQLEEMFADIREKTFWDIEGSMLWGYFFTSTDKSDLEKIAKVLAGDGYILVSVREIETDISAAVEEWQLHVERVEVHTVDSLYNRNGQLGDMAARYRAVIYDGMDVGPAS